MQGILKRAVSLAMASGLARVLVLLPFYFLRHAFYSVRERSTIFYRFYPGYHGSTIPSLRYLSSRRGRILTDGKNIQDGIDLNEHYQSSLLESFSGYYGEFKPPEKESANRLYYSRNGMFGFGDGFILYSFMRHFKPARIIEVGSGFSSGLMLDVCAELLPHTELTFVDPYSTTILDMVRKKPEASSLLVREEIQHVSPEKFNKLNANDILFIDTSHVLKTGSDLSTLFFTILPSLKDGVIIHIHDIWYPWEYPEKMIREGRAYNEIYFVRSFLQFNRSFEIMFFSSYLQSSRPDFIRENMPEFHKYSGQSLWIRKRNSNVPAGM